MKTISFFLIFLTLFSCTKVGPNFSVPNTACQQEWVDENDSNLLSIITDHENIDSIYWWKLFNDPILDELIDFALKNNPTLHVAAFRVFEAKAERNFAIGNFFPQDQSLFGDATRTQLSKNAPNTIGADLNFWQYTFGFQSIWELDFFGKYRRAIESSQYNLFSTWASYEDAIILLLAEVASNYINLRTSDEIIKVIKQNIKAQQRSVEITEARYKAGLVTELDVAQSKTLLSQSKALLPQAELDRRQAQNQLATLLGILPNQIEEILAMQGNLPNIPDHILTPSSCSLLSRRPDVRKALYDVASQSARIGVAFSDLLPQISIFGTIGYQSSGDSNTTKSLGSGSLFSSNSFIYAYGPSFNWPIFNYGRLKSRVHVEYYRYYQLLWSYQQIVLSAYSETETAITSFIKFDEESKSLEEGVISAKRALDLANKQYVQGAVDYTRVLEALRNLLETQSLLVVSKGNQALSLIAAYKAFGGAFKYLPEEQNDL